MSMDVNPKMNRRQFLKGSAMTAAMLAMAPGTIAEGTLEAAPAEAASEEKLYTSPCRSNCFQACTLNAHVRDGKVTMMTPKAYPNNDYPGCCLKGLTLPQETLDKIDTEIEDYINAAGGKSALNTELSGYGVNLDMLRDLYVMEAKYDYLKQVIYGADGELISNDVRLAYLNEHAVCFKQVLIRAFDYVYETDANGDVIYYLPDENNAKVNNIAYDMEKGDVRLDEFGKIIQDKNGDDVYYLPDGKIAYDTEKGVRAYTYDEQGNLKTKKYSTEELAKHKEAAEEIMMSVEKGDYAAFESLMEEYQISGDDAFVTDGELCFLYTTGDNNYDYLNDIADALAACDEGEIRMISSEYGYNVVMKYKIPDDAVTNSDYTEWFSDLTTRVIAKQFHTLCKPYMDQVKLDEKAFATLPAMKDVESNLDY